MTELKTLQGSEKQTRWANDLREQTIDKLIQRFARLHNLPQPLAERLREPAIETVNDYSAEASRWINPIVGTRLEDHFWIFFEGNAHRFIQAEMKREKAEKEMEEIAAMPAYVPTEEEIADTRSFYSYFVKPMEEEIKAWGGAREGAGGGKGQGKGQGPAYQSGYQAGYKAGLRAALRKPETQEEADAEEATQEALESIRRSEQEYQRVVENAPEPEE